MSDYSNATRMAIFTVAIYIAAQTTGLRYLYYLAYLAGDGFDGTYPPSRAAEEGFKSLGWQQAQEWKASPLILQLYTKPAK